MRKTLGILLLSIAIFTFILSCGKDKKSPTGPDYTTDDISGIIFAAIPGGTFEMGDVEGFNGSSNEKPVHTVSVSPFEMSIHEVTNAQYVEYMKEAYMSGDIKVEGNNKNGDVYGKTGDWSGQLYLDIGYEYNFENKCWLQSDIGTFSVLSGKENEPVVAVTWYGAKAFAEYYGFDLPTEAEWEYACRGGKQYMYGTDDGTIGTDKVNFNNHIGYPTPVGSYPANPYGLYDMNGNVWEWCSDWFDDEYYSVSPSNDPTGPQTGQSRVMRGGTWYRDATGRRYSILYCRSAARSSNDPDVRFCHLGFRVVSR
ncbi:formylglycine-generating enzyme family protein [Candidatus Latescibacterota bacterium]